MEWGLLRHSALVQCRRMPPSLHVFLGAAVAPLFILGFPRKSSPTPMTAHRSEGATMSNIFAALAVWLRGLCV